MSESEFQQLGKTIERSVVGLAEALQPLAKAVQNLATVIVAWYESLPPEVREVLAEMAETELQPLTTDDLRALCGDVPEVCEGRFTDEGGFRIVPSRN